MGTEERRGNSSGTSNCVTAVTAVRGARQLWRSPPAEKSGARGSGRARLVTGIGSAPGLRGVEGAREGVTSSVFWRLRSLRVGWQESRLAGIVESDVGSPVRETLGQACGCPAVAVMPRSVQEMPTSVQAKVFPSGPRQCGRGYQTATVSSLLRRVVSARVPAENGGLQNGSKSVLIGPE